MDNLKELVERAKQATRNSYAPYSKFHVGAVLISERGNLYLGCNVENVSFGLTSCAERNAVFAAVSAEGKEMKIKSLVISSDKEAPISPCGACLQVIAEFSTGATEIVFIGENGVLIRKKINELLPFVFRLK